MFDRPALNKLMDDIRQRTTLSDVIRRSVALEEIEGRHRGRCPACESGGRTLHVDDEKFYYQCSSCCASGDAFRWLTRERGIKFSDAVRQLAAEAGFDPAQVAAALEGRLSPARVEQVKAADLTPVLDAAATWFEEQLHGPGGVPARSYFFARGVSKEECRRFRLGYAPVGRFPLTIALAQFSWELMDAAGLLIALEDMPPYGRFRDRIMIPVHDRDGATIGFMGRLFSEGEPKYLSSPDTPIFEKGRVLFNAHRAAIAACKTGRLIVVEDPFDVIALAAAGIDEAVVPLGTAVTTDQLEMMWDLADEVLVAFEAEAAGKQVITRLAVRALPLLKPGRALSFVALPDEAGPDDLARRRDWGAFEARIAAARPVVSVFTEMIVEDLRVRRELAEVSALERFAALSNDIPDDEARRAFFLAGHRLLSTAYSQPRADGPHEA